MVQTLCCEWPCAGRVHFPAGPTARGWRGGRGDQAAVRPVREREEVTQRRRRANIALLFLHKRGREKYWVTPGKQGKECSWEGGKDRNQPLNSTDLTTSKSQLGATSWPHIFHINTRALGRVNGPWLLPGAAPAKPGRDWRQGPASQRNVPAPRASGSDPNLSQMCNCSSFQTGSFNTGHCVRSQPRSGAKTKVPVPAFQNAIVRPPAFLSLSGWAVLLEAVPGPGSLLCALSRPHLPPPAASLCLAAERREPPQARAFRLVFQLLPPPAWTPCLSGLQARTLFCSWTNTSR